MFEQPFIIAVIAMGGLGIFFAGFLALANKKLKVYEDPIVMKVLDEMPQTNCGACGHPGCPALAELIVKGEAPVNACTAGGQELADTLAKLLGVQSLKSNRQLAVVLCRGGEAETQKSAIYRGDKSCAAADLTGGEKSCAYSCLGYADCVVSCEFSAIGMDKNGLPVVFYDKCVGCGACVKACPRDIIEMHPENEKLFVYCRNKDKGPIAKKACKVACIACTLCVKDATTEGSISMKDDLAVIDYATCIQDAAPTKRCPTKCILFGEEEHNTSESYYGALPKKTG